MRIQRAIGYGEPCACGRRSSGGPSVMQYPIDPPAFSDPMLLVSDEVVTAARNGVFCWLATVNPDGKPSVSPKEFFAVVVHDHLVVPSITSSPKSVRNIRPWCKVCINFIDVWQKEGFEVIGATENIGSREPGFSRQSQREAAWFQYRNRPTPKTHRASAALQKRFS